jgi:hypothetical protein
VVSIVNAYGSSIITLAAGRPPLGLRENEALLRSNHRKFLEVLTVKTYSGEQTIALHKRVGPNEKISRDPVAFTPVDW